MEEPTTPAPGQRLSIAIISDPNSVHIRRWAAYFAARGHQVTLLVGHDREVLPGLAPGVEVERFTSLTEHRSRIVGVLAARRSLRAVLRRLDPDVLHAHHVTVNAWHCWLSGFRPYAVTAWGTDVLITARQGRRGRLYAWLALHNAALVTGGSDALTAAAIAAGARPGRTRYVHFGVDVDRFRPGEAPAGLRRRLELEGSRVVFSPRTIAPLYHQSVVVDAIARLPEDVVVLMTRHLADRAELARVEALARALGLEARLRVLPGIAHAEMPDFYRLADVVVSVPESDGGPNTVVETLASGRPIVASDLPANREWLAGLDPAALVPVGDAAAVARAIEMILGRGVQERTARAERARAAVCERADQARSMAEMERLYRALAGRRRRAG